MEQTETPPLANHAVKMGVILAAISILFTVILYVVDIGLMADWKVGLVYLVIYLAYVIYAGIQYRNLSGGFLPYGKAFQHGYITLVVAGAIGILFSILLYHVIDPSIPETLTRITLEKTEEMMKGFGMPEDKLEEAMEQAEIDTPGRFTVVGLLTQFAWGLLINAVIVAITSLFVKKSPPETI